MLYYLHTQTHNKYKDRSQNVLLTKPPSQRTNTCLTNRNMIIFCPKHNHKPFPPPEDTTHTDEVWIGSRSSRISTIVANIDGTIYLYFHEAPQALNKVLRDVYTSKLSARLSELEKDQEKHAIKLIRAANATIKATCQVKMHWRVKNSMPNSISYRMKKPLHTIQCASPTKKRAMGIRNISWKNITTFIPTTS